MNIYNRESPTLHLSRPCKNSTSIFENMRYNCLIIANRYLRFSMRKTHRTSYPTMTQVSSECWMGVSIQICQIMILFWMKAICLRENKNNYSGTKMIAIYKECKMLNKVPTKLAVLVNPNFSGTATEQRTHNTWTNPKNSANLWIPSGTSKCNQVAVNQIIIG